MDDHRGPPLPTLLGAPPPLPSLGPLIGRAHALEALASGWAEPGALLTIVGFGGAGKTHLALAFVEGLTAEGRLPWCAFADLAEGEGAEELLRRISAALGLPPPRDDVSAARQELGRALGGRGPGLLVLDGAESALDALCETLPGWIAAAPMARFIITSRAPLHLPRERVVELGPMGKEEGAALFDHYRRRLGGRVPEGEDRREVEGIIEDVDGLPLAITMAAARSRILSVSQIRARLSRSLSTLQSRERGGIPRQRSIEATLEWTWELLTERERETLLQCACFQGAFELKAARAVIRLGGAEAVEVCLESLRERCLLWQAEAGRLRLHALVRSWLRPRMERWPGARDAALRHGAYYVERHGVEWTRGLPLLSGEEVRRLTLDEGQLRGAVLTCAPAAPALALRAALALVALALNQGPVSLGRWALTRGLPSEGGALPDALWAQGRMAQGCLLHKAGEMGQAAAHFEALLRDLGSGEGTEAEIFRAYLHLEAGISLVCLGRLEAGEAQIRRSLQSFQALGDPGGEGRALAALGRALRDRGEVEESLVCLGEARVRARNLGDARTEITAAGSLIYAYIRAGRTDETLGLIQRNAALAEACQDARLRVAVEIAWTEILLIQGELEASRARLEVAIGVISRLGMARLEATAWGQLGMIAMEEGDLEEADQHFRQAQGICHALNDPRGLAIFEAELGLLSCFWGQYRQAHGSLERCHRLLSELGDAFGANLMMSFDALALLVLGEASAAEVAREAATYFEETATPVNARVALLLRSIQAASLGQLGLARARMAEAQAPAELPGGGRLDPRAHSLLFRHLQVLLESYLSAQPPSGAAPHAAPATALWVHPEGRAFAWRDRAPVALGRRGAARRLLVELARRHLEGGPSMEVYDLFEVGWPGQGIDVEAAAHRVYVTLSDLRKLGLGDALVHDGDGYRFAPELSLSWDAGP